MNDKTTRELIGVAEDCEFGDCESVQAMVVWADTATNPIALPARAASTGVGFHGDPLAGLTSSGAPIAPPGEPSSSGVQRPPADRARAPVARRHALRLHPRRPRRLRRDRRRHPRDPPAAHRALARASRRDRPSTSPTPSRCPAGRRCAAC